MPDSFYDLHYSLISAKFDVNIDLLNIEEMGPVSRPVFKTGSDRVIPAVAGSTPASSAFSSLVRHSAFRAEDFF